MRTKPVSNFVLAGALFLSGCAGSESDRGASPPPTTLAGPQATTIPTPAPTTTVAPTTSAVPTTTTGPTPATPSTSTQPAPTTTVFEVTAEAGGELVKLFCTNCHSQDGTPRMTGPTWLGLAGSEVALTDGSTVLADSAYLLQSIIDPASQVVAGEWIDPMPIWYVDLLTADQIDALVLYIETLSSQ